MGVSTGVAFAVVPLSGGNFKSLYACGIRVSRDVIYGSNADDVTLGVGDTITTRGLSR